MGVDGISITYVFCQMYDDIVVLAGGRVLGNYSIHHWNPVIDVVYFNFANIKLRNFLKQFIYPIISPIATCVVTMLEAKEITYSHIIIVDFCKINNQWERYSCPNLCSKTPVNSVISYVYMDWVGIWIINVLMYRC